MDMHFRFHLSDGAEHVEYTFWYERAEHKFIRRDNERGWEQYGRAAFLGLNRDWSEQEAVRILETFNTYIAAEYERQYQQWMEHCPPGQQHFWDVANSKPVPVSVVYRMVKVDGRYHWQAVSS